MGNTCICRRTNSADDAVGLEGDAEFEKRRHERLQKLATARDEALRTLKTSKALTRAETTRQRKIQEARDQLGIKPPENGAEDSSDSEIAGSYDTPT